MRWNLPKAACVALAVWVGAGPRTANAQAQGPHARQVHVLAAADLQPVLPVLAEAFRNATGIELVASYGSSATLATQVMNGDPADLFMSADFEHAEQIVAKGLADAPDPVPYARGALVLWARKDSPLQPLTQNTLRGTTIQSIAIADPLHAPYGLAAERALMSLHVYDQLKAHLVIAENIAQAAQFVESGNAQLGLISLTTASTAHMQEIGSFIRMQPGSYPDIRQCAVVMKASAHRADAHAFLDWLRTPAVQLNLSKYGLEPVK